MTTETKLSEIAASQLRAMVNKRWEARELRAAATKYADVPAEAKAAWIENADRIEREAVAAQAELDQRTARMPRVTRGRIA